MTKHLNVPKKKIKKTKAVKAVIKRKSKIKKMAPSQLGNADGSSKKVE